MNELDVVGVRVELPSNLPIVLLRESAGERYLPIWVGQSEAQAIAAALEGTQPPRPLTHDLFRDTLKALGRRLTAVHITALRGSTFYAELLFDGGVTVSSRSSDGIALALRCGAKIYAAEPVLAEAGILLPDDQEDEVERFREFLDQVSPEDFES